MWRRPRLALDSFSASFPVGDPKALVTTVFPESVLCWHAIAHSGDSRYQSERWTTQRETSNTIPLVMEAGHVAPVMCSATG
jgi:hypothetical protein